MKHYSNTMNIMFRSVSVCVAINAYSQLIIGTSLKDIYEDFAGFWRKVTQESQLRWVCLYFSFSVLLKRVDLLSPIFTNC